MGDREAKALPVFTVTPTYTPMGLTNSPLVKF